MNLKVFFSDFWIAVKTLFIKAPPTAPVIPTHVVTEAAPISSPPYSILSWETSDSGITHPRQCTLDLCHLIAPVLSIFQGAKDISKIRGDFVLLNPTQQVSAIAQMLATCSYYECSWDWTQSSVDVGDEDDKDTYSVGAFQMSVCDQANYGIGFGYDFADLQTYYPNARLAVAILCAQIKKYGTILMPAGSNVYWATMEPGGKYDKSKEIIASVQAMKF